MSASEDQTEDFTDHWDSRLKELKARLPEHLEEKEDENPDIDLSEIRLSQYSARQLGNGDYVISTPGKVYMLKGKPMANPTPDIHERGSTKEGYSKEDEKLEDLIEEELGV